MRSGQGPAPATAQNPNIYEGPADRVGDVKLHQRFFSYSTGSGWVAGKTLNVAFTVDHPASAVWRHLKDFNPWQGEYGHDYSGVLGDLEGKTCIVTDRTSEPSSDHVYNVIRVIPEHLIALTQPLPDDARAVGLGPDFHVFMLDEQLGSTTVTCFMEHAAHYKDLSEEDALRPYREVAPESQRKWRDVFIPALKKLMSHTQ